MMTRRRHTIRGIDGDAWEMLIEVRESSRTQTGALLSDALRFWYDHLPWADETDSPIALEH